MPAHRNHLSLAEATKGQRCPGTGVMPSPRLADRDTVNRMTELSGVAHIVLRVDDWKRAARWYEQVLGFERRQAEGFAYFTHPSAGFIVILRPTSSPLEPTSAATQRIDHLALLVPAMSSLDAWRDRLRDNGIEVEVEQQAVGASITLHDPDGLEVELFCPSEGSPLNVRSVPSRASSAQ
jgi:catechol 2,3-dioxygenase-like lactoylglutathione lyase family enzyme